MGAILLNSRQPSDPLTSDKTKPGGFLFRPGLLFLLLMSGIGDTWVKVFGAFCDGQLSDQFLLLTFIAAAVLCFGMMLYKKQRVGFWELFFGAAIAIPNYYNSRFLLKSLQTLPGIIVYPTFSVATLLLITILIALALLNS